MTFADLLWRIGALLYNNKQSVLGVLVIALAFIQGNEALRDLLSEKAYAWTMFGVGLLNVIFARSAAGGVVSTVLPASVPATKPPPPQPPAPPESGYARVGMLVLLTALAACASIGVQPVTWNERVAACVAGATAVRQASIDLLNDSLITPSQAEQHNDEADVLRQGCDAADTLHGTDPESAEGKLKLAMAAVEAARAELRRQAGEP